jgi:hypothetical protein
MSILGILAFGSLIKDPGTELAAATHQIVDVTTPFPVEFAHYSESRGGAATLCRVVRGTPVAAKLLVLKPGYTLEQARNILYRREIHQVGTNRAYSAKALNPKKAVRIGAIKDFSGVETALFTDFCYVGKVRRPNPVILAQRAIASVAQLKEADITKNGIAYLVGAKASGIATALTPEFEAEILRQTQSANLAEALAKEIARRRPMP